ncbi:MAG: TAXI family TRAP transporter solute-binding subunit, partial [Deltaproteobacteria bacterium]|nr:TAXI family TRAP transporter solute-binding subunit [Deltaproteobacteria bacterium]
MKRLLVFTLGLALCGTVAATVKDASAQNFLVIGGGSTTGVYYQVALNICKIVNDKLGAKGYNCIGRPALGSVFNIRSIQRGLLNYGVAQSDWVWAAANGKKNWKGKADKGLRTVFTVHPEAVMLVTRKD